MTVNPFGNYRIHGRKTVKGIQNSQPTLLAAVVNAFFTSPTVSDSDSAESTAAPTDLDTCAEHRMDFTSVYGHIHIQMGYQSMSLVLTPHYSPLHPPPLFLNNGMFVLKI